jgi:hypothetical protein
LRERTIYRSYPVYHPDREPPGYWEQLQSEEPQVAFDAAKLKTKQDWIAAGELVFNAGTSFGPVFFSAEDVRDRTFYEEAGMPVGRNGVVPFARWVIREKGKVELASMGCNTCHTRVLDDGRIIAGAQGNNPGDRQGARLLRRAARFAPQEKMLERVRQFALQFEMPWLKNDPNRRARTMSFEQLAAAGEAIPPGVTARSFTSMFTPPQIPDLIGVRDVRYLDHTGLVQQRSIADLMRYASLVQDLMGYARYGEYPPQRDPNGRGVRYSDAQLYALALYLYSLEPPSNPHSFGETARRGKQVFETAACGNCHTPPLYTSNKLIPADGFELPSRRPSDAVARPIGVDSRYTLATRKGTGYYKIPSLRGVWRRGPLEHNGSVATLEDWFDPARLSDDYRPTGFRGAGVETRAVRGHRFGLDLDSDDKSALIAFLRTL